jgi:putative sugar O-methyltransferase
MTYKFKILIAVLGAILTKRKRNAIQSSIDELKNATEFLQVMPVNSLDSSQNEWSSNLNLLLSYFKKRKVEEFLTWDIIVYTMFVWKGRFINMEYDELINSNRRLYSKLLVEDDFGKPIRYWKRMFTSANLIHHVYHVHTLLTKYNFELRNIQRITEFGGGYGSMCRVFRRFEYFGKYVIFDFPHFSEIQKFYLSNIFSNNRELYDKSMFYSDVAQYPNFVQGQGDKALFLATWSLSETPSSVRDLWKEEIFRHDFIFIAFQKYFNEMNNYDYFTNLFSSQESHQFVIEEIQHLKGNYYLFAIKN